MMGDIVAWIDVVEGIMFVVAVAAAVVVLSLAPRPPDDDDDEWRYRDDWR